MRWPMRASAWSCWTICPVALPMRGLRRSPIVGDAGDATLVATLIEKHKIDAIIHFAGSSIVPVLVKDPIGFHQNTTSISRSLIEASVKEVSAIFIFSSSAAVYGNPTRVPVAEDDPTVPTSPYGWSKLMT